MYLWSIFAQVYDNIELKKGEKKQNKNIAKCNKQHLYYLFHNFYKF